MRGTSGIVIGEVADMVREITVRNVVLGNFGSPGGLAPPCGGRGATALPFGRDKRGPPAVGRAAIGGGFLSHGEGIFEPRWESDLPTIRVGCPYSEGMAYILTCLRAPV